MILCFGCGVGFGVGSFIALEIVLASPGVLPGARLAVIKIF